MQSAGQSARLLQRRAARAGVHRAPRSFGMRRLHLPRLLGTRLVSSSTSTAAVRPPSHIYREGIEAGELRADDRQAAALEHLDRLYHEMCDYRPAAVKKPPSSADSGGGGFFASMSSLLGGAGSSGSGSAGSKTDGANEPSLDAVEDVPLGLYMYGGVGVGKSLLMDTFFEVAPIDPSRKRRLHFHEFMLEVHQRLHEWRQKNADSGDPLPHIAADIAASTQLLCFDEFQVTDVADAMVMRRLFRTLFSEGLIMVATSNRKPTDLYLNGIQRASFLPFIDDLQQRCHAHDLASGTDYRTINALDASGGTYMHPLDEATRARAQDLFVRLTKGSSTAQTLKLRGRTLEVPSAGNNVARFTFGELCGRPLGAEDYLGIASAFHTVLVEEVPPLSLNEINQVRRLITMVDAFYDQHVRLILTAALPEDELFVADRSAGAKVSTAAQDEVFAFDRTLSRLREMRSHAYLVRAASAGMGGHALFNTNRVPVLLYESESVMSEAEASQLFTSYDVDASGALERPEIKLLLQDLCERRRGHRNVSEEEVEHAYEQMDSDGNGEVNLYEFTAYLTKASLSNVRLLPTRFDDGSAAANDARSQHRGTRVSRDA